MSATIYKPEYPEQARKLCLLGATDIELAEFFGIGASTLTVWKKRHTEFRQALVMGKKVADAEVANKLYCRALGYSHPETLVKIVKGEVFKIEVIKHYAPDTTAGIFWLKNRSRQLWRDKQEYEHSGAVLVSDLSDEQLDAKIEELARQVLAEKE